MSPTVKQPNPYLPQPTRSREATIERLARMRVWRHSQCSPERPIASVDRWAGDCTCGELRDAIESVLRRVSDEEQR